MIRGIILLILSCVVLTLGTAQPYCTCQDRTKPVYEQAYDYFPTPSTKEIDYTVKPNPCDDLKEFYDKVSVPDHGFIKSCSTGILGGLLTEVEGLLAEVLQLVDNLLNELLGIKKECGIIEGLLGTLLRDVRRILGSITDPLSALHIVDNLLDVLSKKREMAHAQDYAQKSYEAAKQREVLVQGQKDIYGKYMTVSREIDSKQKSCTSGGRKTGGLLGGVLGGGLLGGVLGGGSCDRGNILDGVLGLVGQLVGTVLSLVGQLLEEIIIDLDHFLAGLNICLDDLINLDGILGLFENKSAIDYYENDLRHNCLYPMMTKLQNYHTIGYEDVYQNVANIMSNEQAKEHYLEMAGLPAPDYEFSDYQCTCKNTHTGLDIGLGVHLDAELLGLLSVCVNLDVEVDILCDVRVKVTGGDVHTGGLEYMEGLRVVSLGLFGCNDILSDLLDVDLSLGLAIGQIKIGQRRHCLKSNALLGLGLNLGVATDLLGEVTGVLGEVTGGLGVTDILGGLVDVPKIVNVVPGLLRGVLGPLDSITDVTTMRRTISDYETQIVEKKDSCATMKNNYDSIVKEVEDYPVIKKIEIPNTTTSTTTTTTTTVKPGSSGSIVSSGTASSSSSSSGSSGSSSSGSSADDNLKNAIQCVNTLTDSKTLSQKEYKAALENYRIAKENAELRALTCQKEYAEALAQLQISPNDETIIAVCAAAKIRLGDALGDCLFLQKLFEQIEIALSLKVDVLGIELVEICADLNLSLENMAKGIFRLVEDLKIDLKLDVNLQNLIRKLSCILTGLRPTLQLVECVVDDALGLVDGVTGLLGLNIHLVDTCHEGETEDHMRQMHEMLVQSAVAACTQNPHVQCTSSQPVKRSVQLGAQVDVDVHVIIGISASIDVQFATQENGMSATTETTSSASSLVFSFFVLFVSVLCFF